MITTSAPIELLRERLELARLTAAGFGDGARALLVAVDDGQQGALLGECFGGTLAHLAGPHEHHAAPGEFAEDALGEITRDRAHADRARGDASLGAHALGHGESAVHAPAEQRADRARPLGQREGVLDLPEDLRLPHDQGVEARGHAKGVLGHGLAVVFVEVAAQVRAAYARAQEVAHGAARHQRALGAGVELHAVAGGDQHRLLELGLARKRAQRIRQRGGIDGQLLAHLEGSGVMREANEDELCRHYIAPEVPRMA